ncbi:MAG: hypothetical protein GX086_12375 [Alcaligenaceae bacterium]|nr:hypothetical protein [Alcaligenaceae bacterium]
MPQGGPVEDPEKIKSLKTITTVIYALNALSLFVMVGYVLLVAVGIWYIYRIVKGWLRLADNKPMYVD